MLESSSIPFFPNIPQKNILRFHQSTVFGFCPLFFYIFASSYVAPVAWTVLSSVKPNHTLTISQTSLVKGQSLHRCVGVSWSLPHSLHVGSTIHPHFIKLFAVKTFLCIRVHAKNLHFGSVLAFQIGIIDLVSAFCGVRRIFCPPPTNVIFDFIGQLRVPDGLPEIYIIRYFLMWTRREYMRSIHLFFSNAFCTEILFLRVLRNKLGAILFAEVPCIHVEVQNSLVKNVDLTKFNREK